MNLELTPTEWDDLETALEAFTQPLTKKERDKLFYAERLALGAAKLRTELLLNKLRRVSVAEISAGRR